MSPYTTGRLSDFENGQGIALRCQNLSYSRIGKQLNSLPSTLRNLFLRYQKRGTAKNLTTPGRPKPFYNFTQCHLARESKKACCQTFTQLCNNIAPQVSVNTVPRSLLASMNIKKWRARTKAILKNEHVVKRLVWAKE